MMTQLDILQKQLDQYYSVIAEGGKARLAIRNWCMTLEVALITVISTGKLILDKPQKIILTLTPVFFFWMMEGIQLTQISLDITKVAQLEQIILEHQENASLINVKTFYASSINFFSLKKKLKYFLNAAFLAETIVLFYIFLILFCLIFIIIL